MKIYLGVDYGSTRVGLAFADSESRIATPYSTVHPSDISKTIASIEQIDCIVVGLPRSLDGNDTIQTENVRRFCKETIEPLGITYELQDEAGTSGVAEDILRSGKKRYVRGDVDALAAALILQDYIDAL